MTTRRYTGQTIDAPFDAPSVAVLQLGGDDLFENRGDREPIDRGLDVVRHLLGVVRPEDGDVPLLEQGQAPHILPRAGRQARCARLVGPSPPAGPQQHGIARADAHLGLVLPGLDLGARDACARLEIAHTAQARNIGPCVATKLPYSRKKDRGIYRDKPGCRFARAQADPGPVFGPERAVGSTTCGHLPKIVARRVRWRLPPPPPSPPDARTPGSRGANSAFFFEFQVIAADLGRVPKKTRRGRGKAAASVQRIVSRTGFRGPVFRGIRRQRRTTVRAAQPRAVDRKSLRLRESASQVSRSYPVLSRVQNF